MNSMCDLRRILREHGMITARADVDDEPDLLDLTAGPIEVPASVNLPALLVMRVIEFRERLSGHSRRHRRDAAGRYCRHRCNA